MDVFSKKNQCYNLGSSSNGNCWKTDGIYILNSLSQCLWYHCYYSYQAW